MLASTSDKASTNMKFYSMHGVESSSEVTYKTLNLNAEDERYIFFVSDVPHLLKTLRNNLFNSRGNKGKRLLKVIILNL